MDSVARPHRKAVQRSATGASGSVRAEKKRDGSFGPRIRRLRHASGLTLQDLGERTGLAFSTISKIEKSQISPTYENILRLADGLAVDVATLFNDTSVSIATGRRTVTRAGKGVRHASPQYAYEMLCSEIARKQFIPLLTRICAHDRTEFGNPISHEGEEFIFVLTGEIDLFTDEYQPLRLTPGDSCYFDSTMRHACVSVGRDDATILWVCSRVTAPLA